MNMRDYEIVIPTDLQKCKRLKSFLEKIDEPIFPNSSAWLPRKTPTFFIFLYGNWLTSRSHPPKIAIEIDKFLSRFDKPWYEEL